LRDLLVQECPIIVIEIDFSNNKYSRLFFHQITLKNCLIKRKIIKYDSLILDLDKVFCVFFFF